MGLDPGSVIVTGAAGFIGAHVSQVLLDQGYRVLGIDELNNYYDVRLKRYRLACLIKNSRFSFCKVDICDRRAVHRALSRGRYQAIFNLAARAGVRYSMRNPEIYMRTNAMGTLALLEEARSRGIRKFVLASTSSLYAGLKMPFKETLSVNTPISPYAASKKAAEAMCYTYHHLYHMDVTILRYFTVYGPAGRPDMSIFRFIKWLDEGKPLRVLGDGHQKRDFTHVSDIADGTVRALRLKGYQIINLGGSRPEKLMYAIRLIEKELDKKATFKYLPKHVADMSATWADTTQAHKMLGWKSKVTLEHGIRDAVGWYKTNRHWLSAIDLRERAC